MIVFRGYLKTILKALKAQFCSYIVNHHHQFESLFKSVLVRLFSRNANPIWVIKLFNHSLFFQFDCQIGRIKNDIVRLLKKAQVQEIMCF